MERSMSLQDTLGNEQWLRDNEDKVKALLPDTWTHMGNLNGLQIGFGLKLLGIDWRSEDEFGRVMLFLERQSRFQLSAVRLRLRLTRERKAVRCFA